MPNKFELNIIRKLVRNYYLSLLLNTFDEAVKINYNL